MNLSSAIPNISAGELWDAIKKEYAEVARVPDKGYHFHTGREALKRIGYNKSLYGDLPEPHIASFAGTGNPFALGPIHPGDTVVDVGSGAGLDTFIAARQAGPTGRVVGIDMTPEMLDKARAAAEAMGMNTVEFRKGMAEELPLPDGFADVLISNGVLNLTMNKIDTLTEWARVLKPGGRLYIGDIVVAKAIPAEAMGDISLWTG